MTELPNISQREVFTDEMGHPVFTAKAEWLNIPNLSMELIGHPVEIDVRKGLPKLGWCSSRNLGHIIFPVRHQTGFEEKASVQEVANSVSIHAQVRHRAGSRGADHELGLCARLRPAALRHRGARGPPQGQGSHPARNQEQVSLS